MDGKRRSEAGSKQSKRFMEAARELEADQSEEEFDQGLRRIAKAPASLRPVRKKQQ